MINSGGSSWQHLGSGTARLARSVQLPSQHMVCGLDLQFSCRGLEIGRPNVRSETAHVRRTAESQTYLEDGQRTSWSTLGSITPNGLEEGQTQGQAVESGAESESLDIQHDRGRLEPIQPFHAMNWTPRRS